MQETASHKVALVAPVHNRRETTLQALRSLSHTDLSGLEVKIFIVDDGSTDGTADAIKANFPEVEILNGDGSLHYAAGTNRGVVRALGWGADYIVTMNDDAVFHESFLQRLVSTAIRYPRSIVGALLLLWDEPHRAFQVDLKWSTFNGGWVIREDLTAFTVASEPFEVECIVGNCVLFPAEAIRDVGMMDEDKFPRGWGDAQWTTRMRKAGWKLIVDPKAYVWCEPNTNPAPLHSLGLRKVLHVLFRNRHHPLNLKRQFDARWHSAPSHFAAAVSFGVYLFQISLKALKYGILRNRAA